MKNQVTTESSPVLVNVPVGALGILFVVIILGLVGWIVYMRQRS